MISYYKLFDLLNRKGMKKSDLRKVISPTTVARLSKGQYISGEAIDKICEFLNCQPGDIMEHVNKEMLIQQSEELNETFAQIFKTLEMVTGMNFIDCIDEFMEIAPKLKQAYKENPEKFDYMGVDTIKEQLENTNNSEDE